MLDVSQPSVSKVLAHAELQLVFKLFDRVKGRLVATQEAKILHQEVSELYRGLDRIRRVAENLAQARDGGIRIAATPALGVGLMPALVAGYMRTNAAAYFDLVTRQLDQIETDLRESKVDLGLAFDAPPLPGIEISHLGRSKLVLIVPAKHRLAGANSIAIRDMAALPFIQMTDRGPLGQLLALSLQRAGLAFTSVASAETYQIAQALVAKGVGVAIVDEFTARSDRDKATAIIQLEPVIAFNISLLRLQNTPLPMLCKHFIAGLKQQFAEIDLCAVDNVRL